MGGSERGGTRLTREQGARVGAGKGAGGPGREGGCDDVSHAWSCAAELVVNLSDDLSTKAKLRRFTNHCLNRYVSFPTLLVSKLKTHLASGN